MFLSLRLVCNIWCKKEKPPFFCLHFFCFWGNSPQTPLVNGECINFCTNVRIWNDLDGKYGTKFGLLLIKKNVDFRLIITYFGTLRMQLRTCHVILYLGNKMIYIKTLMNAVQIYLLKLKLNLSIGSYSNYKNTFYGYKNKCFHFV